MKMVKEDISEVNANFWQRNEEAQKRRRASSIRKQAANQTRGPSQDQDIVYTQMMPRF